MAPHSRVLLLAAIMVVIMAVLSPSPVHGRRYTYSTNVLSEHIRYYRKRCVYRVFLYLLCAILRAHIKTSFSQVSAKKHSAKIQHTSKDVFAVCYKKKHMAKRGTRQNRCFCRVTDVRYMVKVPPSNGRATAIAFAVDHEGHSANKDISCARRKGHSKFRSLPCVLIVCCVPDLRHTAKYLNFFWFCPPNFFGYSHTIRDTQW